LVGRGRFELPTLRPPHVRVSACKADVLSGESTLLTRLNYRPKPG